MNEMARRTKNVPPQCQPERGIASANAADATFEPDFAANLASGFQKMSIRSRRVPEGPRVPDLATAAGPAIAHLAEKAKKGSTGNKERDERIKKALRERGFVLPCSSPHPHHCPYPHHCPRTRPTHSSFLSMSSSLSLVLIFACMPCPT